MKPAIMPEILLFRGGGGYQQTFNYQANQPGTGTQVESGSNLNTYGKDIANFAKFKGNDKYDAQRLTNQAANDVKVAYMQLQHDFPDLALQFEAMPDPGTCGKKREGFVTYQQMLEDWKDSALLQINNARSSGTRQEIRGAAGAIIENDNDNAAMNAAVTVAAGEAVADVVNANAEEINANVDAEGATTRSVVRQEGRKTRNAVHSEGAATRNTVRQEGQMTRDAVHIEGAATRNTVRVEGAKTRNVVREEAVDTRNVVRQESVETRNTVRGTAQETQEIDSLSQKLSAVLIGNHTQETIKNVKGIEGEIISSNLTHEEKVALINDLVNWSGQLVLSDREIEAKRKEVQDKIENYPHSYPEFTPQEPSPAHEIPHLEYPAVSVSNNEPTKKSDGANTNSTGVRAAKIANFEGQIAKRIKKE